MFTLRWVGGRVESGGVVGSGGTRMTTTGGVGQSSPATSGSTHGSSLGLVPWLTQSWTMNCSHAVISALPARAGLKVSRVISLRLISRGFGTIIRSWSGQVALSGTLRPNRVPAIPISGASTSFQLPSAVRAVRYDSWYGGGDTGSTDGRREVSTRFSRLSVSLMPMSSARPSAFGSVYHGWETATSPVILS